MEKNVYQNDEFTFSITIQVPVSWTEGTEID
jgi:hypothetical protein